MAAATVSLVPVIQIDAAWQYVAEGLERACRRTGGDLTADYLWRECRGGDAFLVVATRDSAVIAAAVFRHEKWTSGRKLRCLSLYGRDMRAWLPDGLKLTSELMRVGGADRLVWDGRPGWGRVLRGARLLRMTYEAAL